MRRGILANREELESLRERISAHPYDRFYTALCRRCALVLQSAPITEMHWQAAWANGRNNAALVAARGIQGRILDLVICDAIDPNPAYRSRAVEELKNLVLWSTWVDPCRSDMKIDLCTAEAAIATAIGLDWLWDEIDAGTRDRIIYILKHRIIEPFIESVRESDAWWYNSVNHWNAVINSACGLVALATDGCIDQAGEVLDMCRSGLQHFFDDLGSEGGWDEGIGYWGYALRYVLLFGESCSRLIDDRKVLHHRGMKHTGLFPIYFSPNGHPVNFGDGTSMPLHGSLYLLDRYFDCRGITWWLDKYAFSHDVNTTDWSQGLFLLFRTPDDKLPEPPELETVKIFSQIGWSAMADKWPNPDFYVAAKTGDLAVSHSQRDMNSIQLQVDGEMLLIDLGHPHDEGSSYFSDAGARREFYEVKAHSHNTIVVGGEDHRPDARGTIRESRDDGHCRWILCDAGEACGEGVEFFRHVVLICGTNGSGRHLVVLDELKTGFPQEVNLLWHVGGDLNLDENKMAGQIIGRKSTLDFALTTDSKGSLSSRSYSLDHNRVDCYMDLALEKADQHVIASVFSDSSLGSVVTKESGENGLSLSFADTKLKFHPGDKYLVFEGIE